MSREISTRVGEGKGFTPLLTCGMLRGKLAVTDKGKLDHQPLFAKRARADKTYISVQRGREHAAEIVREPSW